MAKLNFAFALFFSLFLALFSVGYAGKCDSIYDKGIVGRFHWRSYSKLSSSQKQSRVNRSVLKCCGKVRKLNSRGKIICNLSCAAAMGLCIGACAPEAESCGPACIAAGAACIKACKSRGGV